MATIHPVRMVTGILDDTPGGWLSICQLANQVFFLLKPQKNEEANPQHTQKARFSTRFLEAMAGNTCTRRGPRALPR